MRCMKSLLGSFVLFCCSASAFAQMPSSPPAKTPGDGLNAVLSIAEHEFVAAAEAMPEDKYSFAPTAGEFKGVRTFAEQVKHVAAVNYIFGASVLQEKPPVDTGEEKGPATITSKAEIVKFLKDSFVIDSLADRMGYRLRGALDAEKNGELVSGAVSFGTIQLLPNGELIVLMADHQTTGGYPRIAHIVSVYLPVLAQKRPGDLIYFRLTDQEHAENLLMRQQQHLLQLQIACKFRLQEFFNSADADDRH